MIIIRNAVIDELVLESDTVRVDLDGCKITTVTIKEPEKAAPVDIEED